MNRFVVFIASLNVNCCNNGFIQNLFAKLITTRFRPIKEVTVTLKDTARTTTNPKAVWQGRVRPHTGRRPAVSCATICYTA